MEHDDRERQADEDQRRRAAQIRFDAMGLGRRYADKTFDNYVSVGKNSDTARSVCRRYAETFPARLQKGDCLLLIGNTGTGKNHLSSAIAKVVFASGHTVLHIEQDGMLREIKKEWTPGGNETAAVKAFLDPDLLIIDEVSAAGTPREQRLIMEVVNLRYKEMRPMILLTNLDEAQLEAAIGRHTVDRFKEGDSGVLRMDWKSYRGR